MSNKHWNTDSIPDQKGRIVVITGANSGIGFESAKVFANKGAAVTMAVRSLDKGEAAKAEIIKDMPDAKVTTAQLDLASLKSVKAFADGFAKQHDFLDLLINNAGIMTPPYSKTEDGFESQIGTNHLGHFALTAQLFPLLKVIKGSRVVNVSSNAHKMGKLNFDDLHWEKRKYVPWTSYGDSKLANLYFTFELHRRIQATGLDIMTTAAHPGLTETNLAKSAVMRFFNSLIAQTGPMGALPTLMAATDPSAKGGDYFGPAGMGGWKGYPKRVFSNELSHDEAVATKLWDVSEQSTGVSFPV